MVGMHSAILFRCIQREAQGVGAAGCGSRARGTYRVPLQRQQAIVPDYSARLEVPALVVHPGLDPLGEFAPQASRILLVSLAAATLQSEAFQDGEFRVPDGIGPGVLPERKGGCNER